MKLPRYVKIGPILYRVRAIKNLHGDKIKGKKKGEKLVGHIIYDGTVIRLDAALSWPATILTLVHEIVHGIGQQRGVKLEEKQIEMVAYGVMAMIQDNPELVSLIASSGGKS